MKASDEKKTEVTATTKVRLTIRGQTFEMTMEELKSLHDKIGKVTGQDKPTVIFAPPQDKALPRERPWYPPPSYWQPFTAPSRPFRDPYEVTCGGSDNRGAAQVQRLVSTCSMGM